MVNPSVWGETFFDFTQKGKPNGGLGENTHFAQTRVFFTCVSPMAWKGVQGGRGVGGKVNLPPRYRFYHARQGRRISTLFRGFRHFLHDVRRFLREFRIFLRDFRLIFCGFRRFPVDFNAFPWISTLFREFRSLLREFQRFSLDFD